MKEAQVAKADQSPLPEIEPSVLWMPVGDDDPNERHLGFKDRQVGQEETPTIAYCSLQKLMGFLEREGLVQSWKEER